MSPNLEEGGNYPKWNGPDSEEGGFLEPGWNDPGLEEGELY